MAELLHIDPIKSKKAYQQIVETILTLIIEGKLEYGTRLYNEQELLTLLGVSRPTLREALRVLEFLGIASVTPRRGIVINSPTHEGSYLPLLYILMFEKTGERELFELRQALQVEMAGRAAQEATAEQILTLHTILLETEAALQADYTVFAELDYDFHLELIRSAGNRLAIKLMDTLGALMREQLSHLIRDMPVDQRSATLYWHREILRMIEERNPEGAREQMRAHLKRSEGRVTDRALYFKL